MTSHHPRCPTTGHWGGFCHPRCPTVSPLGGSTPYNVYQCCPLGWYHVIPGVPLLLALVTLCHLRCPTVIQFDGSVISGVPLVLTEVVSGRPRCFTAQWVVLHCLRHYIAALGVALCPLSVPTAAQVGGFMLFQVSKCHSLEMLFHPNFPSAAH